MGVLVISEGKAELGVKHLLLYHGNGERKDLGIFRDIRVADQFSGGADDLCFIGVAAKETCKRSVGYGTEGQEKTGLTSDGELVDRVELSAFQSRPVSIIPGLLSSLVSRIDTRNFFIRERNDLRAFGLRMCISRKAREVNDKADIRGEQHASFPWKA